MANQIVNANTANRLRTVSSFLITAFTSQLQSLPTMRSTESACLVMWTTQEYATIPSTTTEGHRLLTTALGWLRMDERKKMDTGPLENAKTPKQGMAFCMGVSQEILQ